MYNLAIFSNHEEVTDKIKTVCSKLKETIFICYIGTSKKEFLEKVSNGLTVDIIISEIYLDHARIFNLLKKVNEINPNLKSIAITSKINFQEAQELLESGTNYLLRKDFSEIELEKSLRHICKIIGAQKGVIDKMRKLENRDTAISYSIVSSLLNLLMTYRTVTPQFGKRLKFENINYDKHYALLALVDYMPDEGKANDFEGEQVLIDIISLAKKINDRDIELHWFDRSENFVFLLFSDQEIDKNYLLTTFSTIFRKKDGERKTNVKVSVSEISDYPDGRNFRKLYRHAKRCLQYKDLEKAPNVIFYEDLKFFETNEGRVDEHEYSTLTHNILTGLMQPTYNLIFSLVHRCFLPKFAKSREYILSSMVLAIYRGCPYLSKEEEEFSVKDMIKKSVSIEIEDVLARYLCSIAEKYDKINRKWRKKGVAVSYESIVEYVDLHYADHHFSVDDLCRHFNYSKTYLSEILKKHKTSFVKLLKTVRIEEACELMDKEKLSLKEVAHKCGFNSLTVFSNTFKEIKKVSPNKFKKEKTAS
mgnify:CR=1 FL=1